MINCPNCNYGLEKENINFCPNCGINLKNAFDQTAEVNKTVKEVRLVKCNECGEETDADLNYCESCGVKLSGNEEVIRTDVKEEITRTVPVQKEITKKSSEPKFQNKNKQNKKDPYRKEQIKSDASEQNGKQLSGMQISLIVLAIALLGLIILFASGAFDEKPVHVHNVPQNQSNINLNNLQEINRLEGIVNSDTTNLPTVLELAHLLNDSGFEQRSIKYYEMYLRKNPNNADVLVDLGVVYFNLKQYETAKKYMRSGLKVSPNHQIAHLNLGVVNFNMGYQDSAAAWWKKAAAINPNNEIGIRARNLLDKNLNGGN